MQGRKRDSKTISVASQNYNEKMDALYRSEGKLDKDCKTFHIKHLG